MKVSAKLLVRVKAGPRMIDLTLAQARQLRDDIDEIIERAARQDIARAIQGVKKRVAGHFGIHLSAIMIRSNKPENAWPRQLAMWICRAGLKLSLQTVGENFRRDHGAVLHACRVVDNALQTGDAKRVADIKALGGN